MTREQWEFAAGFFLKAHGIRNFTASEVAPIGKTADWELGGTATLFAPPPELLPNAVMLARVVLGPLREHFGKPVHVNSWYRSKDYNGAVGGASRSIHLTCGAADVWIEDVPPLEVARKARTLGAGGVGLYKTFTHVDVRDRLIEGARAAPALWPQSGPLAFWWE